MTPTPVDETDVEQAPDSDGSRVVVQYVGGENADETEKVSLPGYLGALPSIVAPGDLFTVDKAHAAELDAQDEFEVGPELAAGDPDSGPIVREIAGDAVIDPAIPADLARFDEKRAKLAAEGDAPEPEPVESDEAKAAREAEEQARADELAAALEAERLAAAGGQDSTVDAPEGEQA